MNTKPLRIVICIISILLISVTKSMQTNESKSLMTKEPLRTGINKDCSPIISSSCINPLDSFSNGYVPQYVSQYPDHYASFIPLDSTQTDFNKSIPSNLLAALRICCPNFLTIDTNSSSDDSIGYSIAGSSDCETIFISVSKTTSSSLFSGIKRQISGHLESLKSIELDEITASIYWHECDAYQLWLNQQDKNLEPKEMQELCKNSLAQSSNLENEKSNLKDLP